jgi:hypothetical protein
MRIADWRISDGLAQRYAKRPALPNGDARTGAFGVPFNSSEVSARGNLSPAGRSVEWVENPELHSSLTASGFAARENRVNF